jgi:hypothetical protein
MLHSEFPRLSVHRSNCEEYEKAIAFEREHPELFSWVVIKDFLFNW